MVIGHAKDRNCPKKTPRPYGSLNGLTAGLLQSVVRSLSSSRSDDVQQNMTLYGAEFGVEVRTENPHLGVCEARFVGRRVPPCTF